VKRSTSPEAVSLLSGGLDSTVATALAQRDVGVAFAVTINYHQASWRYEEIATRAITTSLNIPHKIFEIDLYDNNGGNMFDGVGGIDDIDFWVPNRNGLFINIAALQAETFNHKFIVVGFNLDEAISFPDNSREFLTAINESLHYSTRSKVQVISPTLDMTKADIMKAGLDLNVPLESLYSCYRGVFPMCGICPSCMRLISAYKIAGIFENVKERFEVGDKIYQKKD